MSFFFFNDTATTEIYTLSLHDALPISSQCALRDGTQGDVACRHRHCLRREAGSADAAWQHRHCLLHVEDSADRKSTRLNSSHSQISYAVFCLEKKTRQL